MAHYVAELMEQADAADSEAREAAQRKCADVILSLWAHRASLPVNRRPLQSFDKIMEAVVRLRGDEPVYYRGFEQEEAPEVRDQVQDRLRMAETVDRTARIIVRMCIDEAITVAQEDEREWLEKGLELSSESDMHISVVLKLMEKSGGEVEKDLAEEARRRDEQLRQSLREFGELCLHAAEKGA